jgi:Dihydroorotate dehydrogenase
MEKKILKSNIPIVVKISPDIHDNDVEKISELLLKYNISSVIISNSTESNRENLKNINKLEKGGLSGKPLEVKSNLLINKFFKTLRSKIKIIGVGGVDSGKSAYEKIINGANLVQLYTGMVYQGPNIASKITKELIEITKNHSVKNISELVGIKK